MKNNSRKAICGILSLSVVIFIMAFIIIPSSTYGLEGNNISSTSLNLKSVSSTTNNNSKPILLDPNPSLIDNGGNLKNNITQAPNIKDIRNGTVADGVSKLLILIPHSSKLQFSIKGQRPENLTDGILSSLINSGAGSQSTALSSSSPSLSSQSSSVTVDSKN